MPSSAVALHVSLPISSSTRWNWISCARCGVLYGTLKVRTRLVRAWTIGSQRRIRRYCADDGPIRTFSPAHSVRWRCVSTFETMWSCLMFRSRRSATLSRAQETAFGQLVNDSAFIAELPDAGHPPAFTVNGDPVTADNLLFLRQWDMPSGSAVVTLSPAELTLISHQLKSHCNRRSMQDILTKVQESLDPLYTSHVNPNLEEDDSQKYATIESATYLNLVAKDMLFNALFPDAFETVASNLSTHFPRYSSLKCAPSLRR